MSDRRWAPSRLRRDLREFDAKLFGASTTAGAALAHVASASCSCAMRCLHAVGVGLTVMVALASCERQQNPSTCITGDQKACACLGGGQGVQVCLADGTYDACKCPTQDLAASAGDDMNVNVPTLQDLAAAGTASDLALPDGGTMMRGACTTATDCDTTHSAGATCENGTCHYTGCGAGWGNCNAAPPDIDDCETNLDTDVEHCGSCGRPCSATKLLKLPAQVESHRPAVQWRAATF